MDDGRKMGTVREGFGMLLGRSCVVSESKDDYKTRKVNDYTYEQGLTRVVENHSNTYRAYTWHSSNDVPLSSHPLGHPISVGVACSWPDA